MSIVLSSRADVAAALAGGRDIALCAYALAPGSAVVRALEAAADRGAHVAVRLQARAFGGAAGSNAPSGVARELAGHGVAVTENPTIGAPLEHLKAAVIDGRAYLDDRNWASTGDELVVRDDDPSTVAAIAAATRGDTAAGAEVALDKRTAIRLEADAIRDAPGDTIDVATESFGACAISAALAARARAGAHVRLAVAAAPLRADRSGREAALLARLAAAGVAVRAVASDEKFALLGARAWVGSANATYAPDGMTDWGATSQDAEIVRACAERFVHAWTTGRDVRAPVPASA